MEENGLIDISGADRVSLLRGLWENAKIASFFGSSGPPFDESQARDAVHQRIDYFCGRCIKTDLSRDRIDPYLYDRDAGTGMFQTVVNSLSE